MNGDSPRRARCCATSAAATASRTPTWPRCSASWGWWPPPTPCRPRCGCARRRLAARRAVLATAVGRIRWVLSHVTFAAGGAALLLLAAAGWPPGSATGSRPATSARCRGCSAPRSPAAGGAGARAASPWRCSALPAQRPRAGRARRLPAARGDRSADRTPPVDPRHLALRARPRSCPAARDAAPFVAHAVAGGDRGGGPGRPSSAATSLPTTRARPWPPCPRAR